MNSEFPADPPTEDPRFVVTSEPEQTDSVESAEPSTQEIASRGRKLEVIAYIVVIIVSLATLAVKWSMRPPEPVAKGDQLPILKDVVPPETDQTLVLAISPNCPHCTKSMPFYRKLIAEREKKNASVSVIVTLHTETPIEEEEAILKKNKVVVDRIVNVDMNELRVNGVPTMMLVDREGKVLEIWHGRLKKDDQDKVLAML